MARLYKDANGMYYRFAGNVAPTGLTLVGGTEPSPSADSEAKPKKAKATRKAKSTKAQAPKGE